MTTAVRSRRKAPAPNATAGMLGAVCELLDRFVAFPSVEARDAVGLWALHTYVAHVFETTPRLAVLSADPGSGKSRVLEILHELCPSPMWAVNVEPAVLWRKIELSQPTPPTILIDEADTLFGKRGSSSARQTLRSIINAGHHQGAKVSRCVGASDLKEFEVFAPVALAGLGTLPDTIIDRSVVVAMKKRRRGKEGQRVEPFRLRWAKPQCTVLRDALAQWAVTAMVPLSAASPELPVEDRDADVWEPLLAIADLAGEEWANRGRGACLRLIAERDREIPSAAALLVDVRTAMGAAKTVFTADLLDALRGMEKWAHLTPHGLAATLAQFGMQPGTVRRGGKTAKGYKAADLPEVAEMPLAS